MGEVYLQAGGISTKRWVCCYRNWYQQSIAKESFFSSDNLDDKSNQLMATLDTINRAMGRQLMKLASEGLRQSRKMKQENRIPAYTTKWEELVIAR